MMDDLYDVGTRLVGGDPQMLQMVLLLVFGGGAVWCLLCFWTELYTVIDTLKQIWRHVMWSLVYGILCLLLAVQAHYAYTARFGPLTGWGDALPAKELVDAFAKESWVEWVVSAYSE